MQNIISKAVSYIFHPLLMPTFGVVVILCTDIYFAYLPREVRHSILNIIILGTFLIPLCFIPFLIYRKITGNLQVWQNKERIIPLLVAMIFNFLTYYILERINAPIIIKSFILSSGTSMLIVLLITLKWRISAHMTGIGGIIGLLLILFLRFQTDIIFHLMAAIFVSGLVGFARLQLNAHKPLQIYTGLITGMTIVLSVMFLY